MSDSIYIERDTLFVVPLLGLGLGFPFWGTASVILTGEPDLSPRSQTTYKERDTLYVVPLLGLEWALLSGEPNQSPKSQTTYIVKEIL